MNNAIELTDEITDTCNSSKSSQFLRLVLYIALGAITWKGLILTYDQTVKMLTKAKYSYILSVIGKELEGKSFSLTTDMRDNKKHQYGDLTPPEMSMALWALSIQLEQCNGTLSDINSMSNNITVAR